jgi:hypothetical protein
MYTKINVVVYDKPKLLNTYQVVNMLSKVLCQGSMKYNILVNKCDFENITVIPQELQDYDVLITENIRVYCNLLNKGYNNISLIPKPIGYDDMLHRIAYKRSLTLEKILSGMKTIHNPEEYVKEIKKYG